MCRSRQALSNEYLITKIDFDTAENEPFKVWYKGIFRYSCNAWIPYSEPRDFKYASNEACLDNIYPLMAKERRAFPSPSTEARI